MTNTKTLWEAVTKNLTVRPNPMVLLVVAVGPFTDVWTVILIKWSVEHHMFTTKGLNIVTSKK